MPPARTDSAARRRLPRADWAGRWWRGCTASARSLGLVLLCIAGTLLNGDFATLDNAMNVLTRTAFIGIIAVGMCFVIISGGIDLSVGSMAALIAGCMILLMNALCRAAGSPVAVVALGMALRAACWARLFGLAHGLLITRGPHRALHRHARHARHLPRLPDLLRQRRRDHARQRAVRRLQPRLLRAACSACRSRCGCSCWSRWPAA